MWSYSLIYKLLITSLYNNKNKGIQGMTLNRLTAGQQLVHLFNPSVHTRPIRSSAIDFQGWVQWFSSPEINEERYKQHEMRRKKYSLGFGHQERHNLLIDWPFTLWNLLYLGSVRRDRINENRKNW